MSLNPLRQFVLLLTLLLLLVACTPPQITQADITVQVSADGSSFQVILPPGSTVEQAYARLGITLTELDRSEPPLYTLLSDGAQVRLVRVSESYEVEQVIIPFERQVLRNETLPEGETRLSQPGANGLQEITYRRVYEDGVEIAHSVVRSVILQAPVPEITMVGSQTPFLSLPIPGRLAYLSAGNAWIMEKTTGNRRSLLASGDLDGRVFCLSANGRWLLYTRSSQEADTINTLWAARVDDDSGLVVEFKVANIIHFAAWGPDARTVAYSTVEPRSAAPGWQANNDLFLTTLSSSGFFAPPTPYLEANSGGVYGWWGMNFAWSPDMNWLAYARPDSVGLFDAEAKQLNPLLELLPFQTGGDWAWVPGISWGPDGKTLYTVVHSASTAAEAPEKSPLFDLAAIPLEGGAPLILAPQVGMFAYPVTSPLTRLAYGDQVENSYQVAYLQAISPYQSDSSRYRLVVMDRDGSNARPLFPQEGLQGLDPQRVVWMPSSGEEGRLVAVIYQDNIWLVDVSSGQAQQITGDGLTTRLDWR